MEEQEPGFIPYQGASLSIEESEECTAAYLAALQKRRSVRDFSTTEVPQSLIENLIKIAATAPSGANRQPYTFCAIRNPKIKKKIREAAEKEEFINYNGRMDAQWLNDLKPLGTNHLKPFLETAPWLIVVFRKGYDMEADGKHQNYYVQESVGLACGFLLTAIHQAGLVTLTHTPSPMAFLQKILKRPENEKPFLLLPVGYPAKGAQVPNLQKKTLEELTAWYL
ncbi:MAG: nitroreductase family protein [Sphingobacteriaceae bacterium]|nr:nitroreductase family protein [Sphingobacteriaceae bacterium]